MLACPNEIQIKDKLNTKKLRGITPRSKKIVLFSPGCAEGHCLLSLLKHPSLPQWIQSAIHDDKIN